MALDTGFYALTQFEVAVQAETTLGTANVTTMQLVNIDGYPSVNFDCIRDFPVRTGAGRTFKKLDAFVNDAGTIKEVSFTAFYDQTTAPIFISNVMGVAVDTSPAAYEIVYNYTGPECKDGDTDTDDTGALTVALVSPEGSNTIILPGCFVSNFKMYADTGTDGGRFKMDVTLKTAYQPTTAQAAPGSMAAYPVTYRTIYDLQGASGVSTLNGNDVVLNKIEVEVNNNVKFFGFDSTGDPQVMARGMPEMECMGLVGVKYDANTAALLASFDEEDIEFLFHNNAWASATFGFKGDYGQITESLAPADVEGCAFVDVPLKFGASTSGNVLAIVP